jgi:hypothetical protein
MSGESHTKEQRMKLAPLKATLDGNAGLRCGKAHRLKPVLQKAFVRHYWRHFVECVDEEN